MKATLKGGNRFVRFLLSHGEKIGIIAIGACAVMLVWSSLGRDRLDDSQQPDDLNALNSKAVSAVTSFTYSQLPPEEKHPARNYSGQAIEAVKPESFPPWQITMDRPVVTTSGPRTDPVLLTAIDLEVSSDSGYWALGDRETADQRRFDIIKKGKEAALKRQQELERNNRGNNRGNNRDTPGRGGEGGYGEGRMGSGEGGMGYGPNASTGGRGNRENGRRRPKIKEQAVILRPRAGVKLTGIERVEEKSWVTIVGRVPIQDQYQLYEDALANSSGYMPTSDIPNYIGYVVERAEVTPAGQGEWIERDKIAKKSLEKTMGSWPDNPPKVVDPKVYHPFLTYPLPPLLLRGWGEEVTHSTMPLAADVRGRRENEADESSDESSEDKPEGEPEGEKDIFDDGSGNRRDLAAGGRPGEMYGGGYGGEGRGEGMYDGGYGRGEEMYGGGYGGGYGGEGRGEGMGYGEGGMGYGEGGMGYGGGYDGGYGGEGRGEGFGMGYGGGYGRLGSGGTGIGKINLGTFQYDPRESHILLRYFDSEVQPGHRYVYRFRLVLSDVNHDVQEKHLAPEVVARRKKSKKSKYRFTDWSEPSPPIGVALSGRVFVAGAEPARERVVDDEPTATLMVRALNAKPPAEIALSKSFSRGSVINTHEKAAVIWADRYKLEDGTDFDFLTGITLLDCTGGDSLGGKELNAPARALVMDSSGRLTVHSELEDQTDVEEFEQTIATGNNRRGGGYGGRGGEGGYGEGGYGEGRMGEGRMGEGGYGGGEMDR
jgi:hypothetical protein